jgi:hypothetical protein
MMMNRFGDGTGDFFTDSVWMPPQGCHRHLLRMACGTRVFNRCLHCSTFSLIFISRLLDPDSLCSAIMQPLPKFYVEDHLFQISWTAIACTNYVPFVLAAVGFAGVGAAGQAVSSVYISEISHVSNIMTYIHTTHALSPKG